MVIERSEFHAQEGKADEVVALIRSRGLALAAQYTGCIAFHAYRCVERPNSIMLLAEWESIEAHLESRQEPAHVEFREMLLPYAAGAEPTVHYTRI
jgi:quinol monooxygenase YgiN